MGLGVAFSQGNTKRAFAQAQDECKGVTFGISTPLLVSERASCLRQVTLTVTITSFQQADTKCAPASTIQARFRCDAPLLKKLASDAGAAYAVDAKVERVSQQRGFTGTCLEALAFRDTSWKSNAGSPPRRGGYRCRSPACPASSTAAGPPSVSGSLKRRGKSPASRPDEQGPRRSVARRQHLPAADCLSKKIAVCNPASGGSDANSPRHGRRDRGRVGRASASPLWRPVAVDDVSLSIRRGEIFGILGPNGAGKTTTVECIGGLRKPDAGAISVLGLDPQQDRDELHQRVGIQLQTSELPDKLQVDEALDLFASFYPDPADPDDMLRSLGLEGKRHDRFSKLSGGQKQRLSIALALIGRPELAILDELTTGLDPQSRRETWKLIEGIRDQGVTVILVTHFMEEAEYLCDRVALFHHGNVIATDTPAALAVGTGQRVSFKPSRISTSRCYRPCPRLAK